MLLWQGRIGQLKVFYRCPQRSTPKCESATPFTGFDDPSLVAFGGLPAVMRFSEQAGLYELVEQHVTLPGSARSEAPIKVSALIAEVVVGADINSQGPGIVVARCV